MASPERVVEHSWRAVTVGGVCQDGLLDELKKALAERILNAELDQHLAAERSGAAGEGPGNHRNGTSRKTVLTGTGKLDLQIPRDRQASFEPQLIAKYRRRFPDFDDKVVSLYARGLTVREIQGHLRELYGIDVLADLVSAVTDAVLEQVAEWQNRPLDAVYALVFFDALRVKIRDEGTVRNKAVYIALGVRPDGTKEILGLWIEQTEGAEVLAAGDERPAPPRRRRRADRGGGRVAGLPLSDQRRVSRNAGPDLRRPPHPALAGLRVLEGAQRGRRGAEADLPGASADLARDALEAFAAGPGAALSGDRARLATAMGAGDPVLRLPSRGPAHDLHDKRLREPEQLLAQSRAAARPFPHRREPRPSCSPVLREFSRDWKMPPREWNAAKTQFAVLFGDRLVVG
jgi:putative transposase